MSVQGIRLKWHDQSGTGALFLLSSFAVACHATGGVGDLPNPADAGTNPDGTSSNASSGTGSSPGSSACTNACTYDAAECLWTSSTEIQSCAVGPNGCMAETTSPCGSDLVCERSGGAACVDARWAEWPMPNAQADVTRGAPNLQTYTANGDGTVTDNVTGLVWQQTAPASMYTQDDALTYCASLGLSGHTDWRLPSVVELVSLIDPGADSPSIDGSYFPSTPTSFFWTSTPYAGGSGDAWNVDFTNGATYGDDDSDANYVRCVR